MLNEWLKTENVARVVPFLREGAGRAGAGTEMNLPEVPGKRIVARRGREYIVFRVEDIAYFYVENGISYMIDRKSHYKYIVAKVLRDIETTLHSSSFFRVNKKYLISINAVVKFRPLKKGKLELTIDPHPNESIIISQVKARAFKEWVLLG